MTLRMLFWDFNTKYIEKCILEYIYQACCRKNFVGEVTCFRLNGKLNFHMY